MSEKILMNFGLLFWEQKFMTADISHTSCRSATKFGSFANRYLFPEFAELWSARLTRYHAATCVSPSLMHLLQIYSPTTLVVL